MKAFLEYYHETRTHLSLEKDPPEPRPVHPLELGGVVAIPQVGGLHHRYSHVTAASPVGNMGRNILRSSRLANLDLGVVKNMRFLESHTLQLRAEFYNTSNTRYFGIPDATLSSANFLNQWGTDGGNRRIVLTLRYAF